MNIRTQFQLKNSLNIKRKKAGNKFLGDTIALLQPDAI